MDAVVSYALKGGVAMGSLGGASGSAVGGLVGAAVSWAVICLLCFSLFGCRLLIPRRTYAGIFVHQSTIVHIIQPSFFKVTFLESPSDLLQA